MPESETFDAFYARTVWNVTSQMHELAGDDSVADHAIREAYARAYQQWYQVSGYADSQAWVLATARDAFARRQAQAGAAGGGDAGGGDNAGQVPDSGTWPGIYRPVSGQGRPGPEADQAAADPDATMAAPGGRSAARTAGYPVDVAGTAGDAGPGEAGYGGIWTAGAGAAGAGAANRAWVPGLSGPAGPRRRPARVPLAVPGSRRTVVIAGAVVVALLIAGIVYAGVGSSPTSAPAAGASSAARAATRAKPRMLPAGKTGRRSSVPWSLVGTGWALAEFTTAPPDPGGGASSGGTYTTYLVDPEGGKYTIAASAWSTAPQLIAWSGNGASALLGTNVGGGTGAAASYSLLNVTTGQLTSLSLPSGVSAVGFTRPDGLNILAVRQGSAKFRLQRYNLSGEFQATIGSLPDKHAAPWPAGGCSYSCALSSPDGLTAVWGISGDEMQLLDNRGGLIRRLHVPGSGKPPSCVPLSWWNDSTILADCAATGLPGDAARLWLVPADGSKATALTQAAAAGSGEIEGAWRAGQTAYVTAVSSRQCPSAPSGSAGLGILRADQAAAGSTIAVPHTTGNVSTIVGAAGKRLLVLAQTSCPGTSSLLWFSPSAGTVTTVLTAAGTQAGVIAAVPYGNGPTALAGGQ